MDHLVTSCEKFYEFPKNIVRQRPHKVRLKDLFQRLDERDQAEYRLFDSDAHAALDFWELAEGEQEFKYYRARCLDDVKKHLSKSLQPLHQDPATRFIFVHAPNSRAALSVTRPMLTFAMSYHQTMSSIVEFLLPFGEQEYPRDFHFSGFRKEHLLQQSQRGLCIPEIGRSGHEIRVCYSLRSVEPAPGSSRWPWSIRQMVVCQSFDVQTGRATWIIIKGNQAIKEWIQSATKESRDFGAKVLQSKVDSFNDALSIHLGLLQWTSDNWGRHISFMEQELQKATRKTLSTSVNQQVFPLGNTFTELAVPSRAQTMGTESNWSFQSTIMAGSLNGKLRSMIEKGIVPEMTQVPKSGMRFSRSKNYSTAWSQNQPASPKPSWGYSESKRMEPPELPPEMNQNGGPHGSFSFRDLQLTQQLEEKAQEVLLVIKLDRNTLSELIKNNQELLGSRSFPEDLKGDEMADFENQAAAINADLAIQQSRVEGLLRLLMDRKQLMHGILEIQTMEASKRLAERGQVSAEKMQDLTKEMHWIAQKTQQETVSMKIITLVTLFFLPGTFISTIMSTDIIRFTANESGELVKTASSGALKLYLQITLPLMLVTFLSWYGVQQWEKRKEVRRGDNTRRSKQWAA